MDRATFRMTAGAASTKDVIGQLEYLTPGTYNLTVAADVYFWSCVAVQGGTGGGAEQGGNGGALRYTLTLLPVVPNETLVLVVGAGGAGSDSALNQGETGAHTTLSRGGSVIFSSALPVSAAIGGGNGGLGGAPYPYSDDANGGGGGGAAGYSGNGGNGGGATPTAGSGGGGGGGGRKSQATLGTGGNGGGVGVRGQGTSGAAGSNTSGTSGGSGSSGLTNGRGGGAGYNVDTTIQQAGSDGGPGAFRAIWGFGRSYPSTRTADE